MRISKNRHRHILMMMGTTRRMTLSRFRMTSMSSMSSNRGSCGDNRRRFVDLLQLSADACLEPVLAY